MISSGVPTLLVLRFVFMLYVVCSQDDPDRTASVLHDNFYWTGKYQESVHVVLQKHYRSQIRVGTDAGPFPFSHNFSVYYFRSFIFLPSCPKASFSATSFCANGTVGWNEKVVYDLT